MKISIIIPILNNVRYLKNLIPTIKSKDHELKIICINNGSTDGTFDYLKQFETDPKYHIEHYKDPLGVAVAWNRGIKLSLGYKADYSYILNTDVALHPEAIDNLVSFFEKNKNELMVASSFNICFFNDKPYTDVYLNTGSFTDGEINKYTEMLFLEKGISEQTFFNHCDYCAFLINPRSLTDRIGWFDEDFKKCYFEDNDMSERVLKAEFKIGSTTKSLLLHFHSRGQTEAGYNLDHFSDNLKYFMKKHNKKVKDLNDYTKNLINIGKLKIDEEFF